MSDTIISGLTTRETTPIWEHFGSGIIRAEKHAGMPVILINGSGVTADLESLVEEANALLSGIFGAVDTLEPLTEAGNALLSGIEAAVDGLEGLATESNILLSGLQVLVDDVEPLLMAISGFTDTTEPLLIAISGINEGISSFVDMVQPSLDTANTTLSGIEASTSGLDLSLSSLQDSADISNTTLSGIEASFPPVVDAILSPDASGKIITDPDGTTQARVLSNTATPSGDLELLGVTVDTKLSSTEVLASGAITGGSESSDMDVSSQLGFYNNAIFVLSNISTTVDILANSDGGSTFANVKTLTIGAGEAAYYDLKGYETTLRIKPAGGGDFIVNLIRKR